jgi:hypothetical protein
MRILLLSPLYPPDIAPPAPYTKELLKHLKDHQTGLLTYGQMPEQVPGAHIEAIGKRQILPVRLWKYTVALAKEVKKVDVIYAQNGASVELPLLTVSLFASIPIVLCFGDTTAHARTTTHPLLRYLERLMQARASAVVIKLPPERPIILPLEPRPTEALTVYETAWSAHIKELENIFSRVTKKNHA